MKIGHNVPKGAFALELFSARLLTEAGKFGLPIGGQVSDLTNRSRLHLGQLTHLTNRQSKFSSLSHESRAKKSQCKRTWCHLTGNSTTIRRTAVRETGASRHHGSIEGLPETLPTSQQCFTEKLKIDPSIDTIEGPSINLSNITAVFTKGFYEYVNICIYTYICDISQTKWRHNLQRRYSSEKTRISCPRDERLSA